MKDRSKKFILYLAVEGMQKAAGIFLIPIYTAYMVPMQFGILSVCLSLSGLIPILFFGSIYEAAYFSVLKQEIDFKDKIVVVICFEVIILFLILLSVALIYLVTPDGISLFNIPFRPYILATIVMSSLSVFQITINQVLVASEKTGPYVAINIASFILITAVTLYLLIVKKFGVMSFIFANSMVYLVYFLAALWMLKGRWRVPEFVSKASVILKFCLPLVPHTMSHWVRAWADRILLAGIVTPSSAGIYQISNTYSGVMLLGTEAFRNANNPRFFSLINDSSCSKELTSMLSISLGIFSFCALVLGMFSRDLIELLTSQSYHGAYRYVPILLSAHLVYLVYINTVNVLFNSGKTHKIAVITVGSSFVSIVVGYWLIRFAGITGAAISVLLANILMTTFIYRECQQTKKLPWPIIRSFMFALLPLTLLFFEMKDVLLQFLFLSIAGVIILVITRKDIKNVLKF